MIKKWAGVALLIPLLGVVTTAQAQYPAGHFLPSSSHTGSGDPGAVDELAWQFTGGVYILQPYFSHHNPAFFVTTVGANGTASSAPGPDLNFGRAVVPRLSLECVGYSGWGIRARWSRLDYGSHGIMTTNPIHAATTSVVFADATGGAGTEIPGNRASPGAYTVTSSTSLPGLTVVSPNFEPLASIAPPLAGTEQPGAEGGFLGPNTPGHLLAAGVGVDQLFFSSHLLVEPWDLEITKNIDLGQSAALVSFGARFAHLSQSYLAARSIAPGQYKVPVFGEDPANDLDDFFVSQDIDMLTSGHTFNGAGPTIQLGLQHMFGRTGLALYGSARSSLLVGRTKQRSALSSLVVGSIVDDLAEQGTNTQAPDHEITGVSHAAQISASRDRTDLIPEAEFEAGLNWEIGTDAHYRTFVQAAVVSQIWWGAGNSTGLDNNLSLLGLTFTVGFDF
jgi:hypothetical protein